MKKVDEIVGSEGPFDSVINFWTSIEYYNEKSDELILTKVRKLTRKNGILIIGECTHRELLTLKFTPRRYQEYEDMVLLEGSEFDPISSRLKSTWRYYAKEGSNLRFLDSFTFDVRVYSINEIASILQKAGWEVIEVYGSVETLQPFTPLTSMNIVSRAI